MCKVGVLSMSGDTKMMMFDTLHVAFYQLKAADSEIVTEKFLISNNTFF
jgi:hypothetical protein